MRKPKIRFKGYTEDWEQRKLSELLYLSNEKNDGSYTRDDVLAASLGTELQKKHIYFGLRATNESVKNYKVVLPKDVIYTKSPIKGFPNGIIRTNKGETGIVPTLYCVYHSIDTINPSIIQAYFESKERLDAYLVPLVNIGARNNVNITDKEFINGSICIPKNETEQNRIVDLLEKISNLITLHQRKCEETKKLKKYMLQKMFPKNGESVPEIRFAGFTDAWEQRKVSEMFMVTRGYVLPATDTSEELSDEMPYPVYSSQTKDNGLMGYYSDYLYEDAITWTTDGANAGTVNFRDGKFYCTNVCGVLLSDKVEASKTVAEVLNNVAKRYVSYVGNPKLMNNVMADIQITIPTSREERARISSYFSTLDRLITLHQRKCDELKNMKQYMLQNMFV